MPSRNSTSNLRDPATLRRVFFENRGMHRLRHSDGDLTLNLLHHPSPQELVSYVFGDGPPSVNFRAYDKISYRLRPIQISDRWYAVLLAAVNDDFQNEMVVIDPFRLTSMLVEDIPLFPEEQC